jgi:hypothetical protein
MSPESIAGLTIPPAALAELDAALEELDLSAAVPRPILVEIRESADRPATATEREAA